MQKSVEGQAMLQIRHRDAPEHACECLRGAWQIGARIGGQFAFLRLDCALERQIEGRLDMGCLRQMP